MKKYENKSFYAAGKPIKSVNDEVRQEVGTGLEELFKHLRHYFFKLGSQDPAPGSRAAQLLFADEFSGPWSNSVGSDIAKSMIYTCLSASDHGEQLGRSLQTDRAVSSLATISRGCIEAMARVHWVISPSEPKEMVARWLSGQIYELKIKGKRDAELEMVNDRGEVQSLKSQILKASTHLNQLGYNKALDCQPTLLVGELLDKAHSNGKAVYSFLSGVAHAEHIALMDFVGFKPGSHEFIWHLGNETAFQFTAATYFPLGVFMREILDWSGSESSKDEEWAKNHDDLLMKFLVWQQGFDTKIITSPLNDNHKIETAIG